MTNSIEVRRGDWEKFKAYHEALGLPQLQVDAFLVLVLNVGVDSDFFFKRALELHQTMDRLARFLAKQAPPFGISALGEL